MKSFEELLLLTEQASKGVDVDLDLEQDDLDTVLDLLCDYYKAHLEAIGRINKEILEATRAVRAMSLQNENIKSKLKQLLDQRKQSNLQTNHWTIVQCLNHGSWSLKIMQASKRRQGARRKATGKASKTDSSPIG